MVAPTNYFLNSMKGLWQLFAALYTITVTNNNDAMFLLPSMDSMTIATVALHGYDRDLS